VGLVAIPEEVPRKIPPPLEQEVESPADTMTSVSPSPLASNPMTDREPPAIFVVTVEYVRLSLDPCQVIVIGGRQMGVAEPSHCLTEESSSFCAPFVARL